MESPRRRGVRPPSAEDLVASGDAALARAAWQEAGECFEAALAREELAPAWEGLSWATQEHLLHALAYGRLEVYEGIGHALHWEQPERFAADVSAFAREVSR